MTIDPTTKRWIRNASDQLAAEAGYRFDVERGAWTVWWIERYCRLYEGDWAGEPLVLRGAASVDAAAPILDDWDAGGREKSIARAEAYAAAVEAGEPVDWQYDTTMRVFGWVKHSDRWGREIRRFRKASVWVAKKAKKALALDTLIPTPTGWTTMGEIGVGDALFDETGSPCRVVSASDINYRPESYRVEFSNGQVVRACGDHLWVTRALIDQPGAVVARHSGQCVAGVSKKVRARTTREIAETLLVQGTTRNHTIAMPGAIQTERVELPIDPYVLGLWLGDGDKDAARITAHEDDLRCYQEEFAKAGYVITHMQKKPGSHGIRFRFERGVRGLFGDLVRHPQPMRTLLKNLNLWSNKHIPAVFMRASYEQRLSLLQGLMDSDGCCPKNGRNLSFANTNKRLVDGACELLASLGVKFRCRERRSKIDGRDCGPHWVILYSAFRDCRPVFRLPRKLTRMKFSGRTPNAPRSRTVQIVSAERCESIPMRCIVVSSASRQFLVGESMIPTHNSPTLAAWGMYLLSGDGESGQKVFLAAKDGKQAREIAGLHAVEMLNASDDLLAECTLNKSKMQITHESSRSFLLPLSSSNSRTKEAKEGLNGSVLIDETHVVDRDFISRISRAGISRSEPLHAEFSTAGNNPDSYGKERFDYGLKVECGKYVDHQLFFTAYMAPQDLSDADLDADPVKYGKMANPSWGHTIGEEEFLADYNESKVSITTLAAFKMYRLNIWQRSTNPWLKMDDWHKCGHEFSEADLYGRSCGGGIDLSKTEDMTALALVFPEDAADDDVDRPVKLLLWYWLPEAAIHKHGHEVPYAQWQDDGWLRIVPGAVIDYRVVRRDIAEILSHFDVSMLAYDEKYARDFMQSLVDEDGYMGEPYIFPQTIMGFAGPTSAFERLVIAGKMQHNNHPITTWQAGHVQTWSDGNNNIRPIKPESNDIKKIDGIVAAVMGLDASTRMPAPSPYASRGFLTTAEDS